MRKLSVTVHIARPVGKAAFRRMRPTSTSSVPAAFSGCGYRLTEESLRTRMPGVCERILAASSGDISCENSISTAAQCPATTGTRVQVAETGSISARSIRFASSAVFHSSFV